MLNRLAMILVVLLLGTAVTLTALYARQMQQMRAGMEQREAAVAAELERLEAEYAARQDYLEKLENDPAYLERVVRARFGYGREGETVIRFERGPG